MGLTKRAVTVIGLQIPTGYITHENHAFVNQCICAPQHPSTDGYSYCPGCGKNTKRRITYNVLNGNITPPEDDAPLFIRGYEAVGDWQQDEYIYIGFIVSSTSATHSAESADPVMTMFKTENLDVIKFKAAMMACNLWNVEKFGIWTVLLVE